MQYAYGVVPKRIHSDLKIASSNAKIDEKFANYFLKTGALKF